MSDLLSQSKAKAVEAKSILENGGDVEVAKTLISESKALAERHAVLEEAKAVAADLSTPEDIQLPTNTNSSDDSAVTAAKSVTVLRYGDIAASSEALQKEVYGKSYASVNDQMERDFAQYMRSGKGSSALATQTWAYSDVEDMLKSGMTVAEVKATMVEGTDILGGYAVPPERGREIIARLRGLTVVREGGARVVQTASKSIEWLKLTGGTSRYSTALRGSWGGETSAPSSESNLTFGLNSIPVHVYTYKAPMSVSLLEDAQNIVSIFTSQVAETLAVDEDDAFLIGDGTNKPRGIIPGSANTRSLAEVNSGSGTALLFAGLRALKRGIDSQYRMNQRGILIGNSDTGGDIEALVDGDTRPYFPEGLNVGEYYRLIQATWRESEAMPDVAANAYPLIYGDMTGYVIVERLGLSVQRYNDSNTGINKVEFHVRRRLGGDVVEPWKFALQKVST